MAKKVGKRAKNGEKEENIRSKKKPVEKAEGKVKELGPGDGEKVKIHSDKELKAMKKSKLIEVAKSMDLPISGTKLELTSRIKEAQAKRPFEEARNGDIKEKDEVRIEGLEGVGEIDSEKLKKKIESVEFMEEVKSLENLLTDIKEERRRLEEERKKFLKLLDEKERIVKKQKERLVKKQKERFIRERIGKKELPAKTRAIRSFARERRKRKELKRFRAYLFGGEYILLLILVLALLYSGGISFSPDLYIPIESSIYLIIAFFLIIKVERFYFRFLNINYSGTSQRKSIAVEHFKGIELPPMIFLVFIVTILLIPSTSNLIRELLSIPSVNGIMSFSPSFTFNLVLLFLASLLLSIAWLTFLIGYREFVLAPELKKIEEPFVIEDVFLIAKSGLLVKHMTRELKLGIDDDILTAMLTAVKDFIKDSFRASAEEGELDELQYGNLRIIIEYGKEVYLASVIKGQESKQLRPKMKRTIKQIHRKFGHVLRSWDGDITKVRGIENMISPLFKPD